MSGPGHCFLSFEFSNLNEPDRMEYNSVLFQVSDSVPMAAAAAANERNRMERNNRERQDSVLGD